MHFGTLRTHTGVCDASGAVSLEAGSTRFLVADDEDTEHTKLRVYDAEQDSPPLSEHILDVSTLKPEADEPEIDLEGAAWMGERIFWIGSHSRSKKGKRRPSRHRLFATRLKNGAPELESAPYCDLVKDIRRQLGLNLDPVLPPKDGGLSIEGLSAGSEPGELVIGLRSPLVDGKSVLLTLLNADDVVDRGAVARFAPPVLLDLGGLGIRSIDYWPERHSYWLIAGPAGDGSGRFCLMRWSGASMSTRPEVLDRIEIEQLGLEEGASPEALLIERGSGTVYILFDEGNRRVNGQRCKDSENQSFHSISLFGL